MKKHYKQVALYFLVGIISSFLGVLIYTNIVQQKPIVISTQSPTQQVNISQATSFIGRPQNSFVHASKNGVKTVVYVQSIQVLRNNFWGGKEYGYSTGSGVIISSDGYIISNRHVIKNASEIKITLNDHREYEATLIGEDKYTDLALLKITAKDLPYLEFGNSDSVMVGQWVLAIGNPFKLQSTVTAGIVSAKARNIDITNGATGIESFIQTDAAVNSGNSGGALLNTNGELIGINTAIISYSGQYEGYSFAVPSNIAKKIYTDLREYGKTQRGWLDITVSSMNQKRAVLLSIDEIGGIYVDAVFEGGSAEKAGIKPADVILGVENRKVLTVPEFMGEIAQYRPGDKINLHVNRKGKVIDILAELASKDEDSTDYSILNNEPLLKIIGITVVDIKEDNQNKNGVKVVSVLKESQAFWANIEVGFIIQQMNNKPILSVEDFLIKLAKVDGNFIIGGEYPDKQGEWIYELKAN